MVIGDNLSSLLPINYMVSDLMVFDGIKGFLIVSEIWYSSCESWNLTSGYVISKIYMNILQYMLTAYKFQQGILRASWIHLKTSISSILREWDQFYFILGLISSVTVMLFYALPHTNIFTRWNRPV